MLRSVGMAVEAYACAEDFLGRRATPAPGCLLLDVRLPGTSGVDLQAELNRLGEDMPIVFITGHGTIPMTVRAMRAGAVEFLTKPFAEADLLEAVQRAIEQDLDAWQQREAKRALRALGETLSPREREVLALVVAGRMNKVIAGELNLSEITVKVHRRHVMEKLGVRTLADLVRVAQQLGIADS